MVNNVYFEDLQASFSVIAVEDDDIHLPEIHEVPLEDLWPTIDQENSEVNGERTADCLDELRLVKIIAMTKKWGKLFTFYVDFSIAMFGCHGTTIAMKMMIGAKSIWSHVFNFVST